MNYIIESGGFVWALVMLALTRPCNFIRAQQLLWYVWYLINRLPENRAIENCTALHSTLHLIIS